MCSRVVRFFFFQAVDGIRYAQESRGLGDVYKRQVHLLPAVFTLGMTFLLLLFVAGISMGIFLHASVWGAWGYYIAGLSVLLPLLYSLTIMADSTRQNGSAWIGLLSVAASYVQLIGYGTGFLRAWWLRCVCGCNEELQAFRETFYK